MLHMSLVSSLKSNSVSWKDVDAEQKRCSAKKCEDWLMNCELQSVVPASNASSSHRYQSSVANAIPNITQFLKHSELLNVFMAL